MQNWDLISIANEKNVLYVKLIVIGVVIDETIFLQKKRIQLLFLKVDEMLL